MSQLAAKYIVSQLLESITNMITRSGGEQASQSEVEQASLNVGLIGDRDKYTVCAGLPQGDGSRPFLILVNADQNMQSSLINDIVLTPDLPLTSLLEHGQFDRVIHGTYTMKLDTNIEFDLLAVMETKPAEAQEVTE